MGIRPLEPGAGENLTRSERKRTTILVDSEAVVVVEFRYAPREPGADPHIHLHHTDSFYVLDGQIEVRVGDSTVTATPGTFVSAPPGLVHGFDNKSDAPARFLNIHTPGMGFAGYLRALREGTELPDFDQHDPPPGGGRPASDGVVVRAARPT